MVNLQQATFSVSVRKRTVRTKFEQRVKISQNASKSTSITENRPLQNGLSEHWKHMTVNVNKCGWNLIQEWREHFERCSCWRKIRSRLWFSQLQWTQRCCFPALLSGCLWRWQQEIQICRKSSFSKGLRCRCGAVMSRAACCSVKDSVRCGDQILPLCGGSVHQHSTIRWLQWLWRCGWCTFWRVSLPRWCFSSSRRVCWHQLVGRRTKLHRHNSTYM